MFRPIRQISRWPTGRPIGKAVNLLVYRITYWPMGRFGIWINPVANREIWCMGQPVYQVHHTNSFCQITSIHSQPTTQSILPPPPAHVIPLSLLLYFVLQLLYWFSFLHSVRQLPQLTLGPGFDLPRQF